MNGSLLSFAALALASAARAQADGKALLDRVCTKCHSLESTLKQRNTRERWSEIVDNMVARGAEASDADLEKIVAYLARNQGPPVAINRASEADIAAAREIPRATAAAIVVWRRTNGPFQTLADLRKVPRVTAEALEGKQGRIAFD